MTTIDDLTTRDAFGPCVEEQNLDTAFLVGKGAKVPRTCMASDVPRDESVLAEALGRPPTADEWLSFNYVWSRENDPDLLTFTPNDPLPLPSVPAPDALGLMIGILSVFVIVALFRHCDDLEGIR